MSTQKQDSHSSPAAHRPTEQNNSTMELNYREYNPGAKSTILLTHGAFASNQDWDLVTPHLSDLYHLLIPDLPSHGQSRHINPFSVKLSSRLISQLINKKAINGRAHIIGHRLGALITIDLASSYPVLVNMVFVSGFEIYPPGALSPYLPYCVWTMLRVENLVPRRIVRWIFSGAEIKRTNTDTSTLELCKHIVPTMNTNIWPVPWPAKTLIVAAGKGGLVPSNDHPEDAVRLMGMGRELKEETVAYTHLGMRHPWIGRLRSCLLRRQMRGFQEKSFLKGLRNSRLRPNLASNISAKF